MSVLQLISFVLDVLLIGAAIAAYLARPQVGGAMAKGLRILLVGVMILGMAHLIESMLFAVFHFGLEINEVLHRLLVVFGFVFVIWGFIRMRQALKW